MASADFGARWTTEPSSSVTSRASPTPVRKSERSRVTKSVKSTARKSEAATRAAAPSRRRARAPRARGTGTPNVLEIARKAGDVLERGSVARVAREPGLEGGALAPGQGADLPRTHQSTAAARISCGSPVLRSSAITRTRPSFPSALGLSICPTSRRPKTKRRGCDFFTPGANCGIGGSRDSSVGGPWCR